MNLGHVSYHMLGVGILLGIACQYHRDIYISIYIFCLLIHAVSSGQHMGGINQCSGAKETMFVCSHGEKYMQGDNPGELIQTSLFAPRYPIPLCWPLIGLAAVTFLVCISS